MDEQAMVRKTLRFDRSLESLNRLIDAFMKSRDKIRSRHSKIIAKWRLFPPEIIYALGATPYDLLLHEGLTRNLSGKLRGDSYAIEAGLSADSCPWNLTSTGMILSEKASAPIDIFLAGAGLCDVSSKSWQIMAKQTGKPIYPVETPIFELNAQKRALTFIQEELSLLFARLGRRLGQQYSESRLREEVKKGNRVRRLLLDVTSLLSQSSPPLNALEYFLIHATAGDYLQDPDYLATLISSVKGEAEKRIYENKWPPGLADDPVRIYYVGMAPQDLQFWNMIEDSGGVLVGCDTYLPLFYDLIPENGPVLEDLAKWIWMMPHHMVGADRAKALMRYIKEQKPEAIIMGNVAGCRSLSSSDRIMKETLKEELGIPITSVEFGASEDDVALLEPHIKAFIEICR